MEEESNPRPFVLEPFVIDRSATSVPNPAVTETLICQQRGPRPDQSHCSSLFAVFRCVFRVGGTTIARLHSPAPTRPLCTRGNLAWLQPFAVVVIVLVIFIARAPHALSCQGSPASRETTSSHHALLMCGAAHLSLDPALVGGVGGGGGKGCGVRGAG